MKIFVWRGARGVALAVGASLALAGSAAASKEGRPLEIDDFTMKTTRTVEKPEGFGRGFENVPYSFTQAGGHPWALTARLVFAGEEIETTNGSKGVLLTPTRDPKDVVVDLPPGLLGDPMAVPRCSLTLLLGGEGKSCPADTQIGVARIRWFAGGADLLGPIVNVTPEAGQSAEFALENLDKIPFLETGRLVRTAQGYGFDVAANNIPTVEPIEIEQTFWGVPSDPSHDQMRGLFCIKNKPSAPMCGIAKGGDGEGGEHVGTAPVPFLTWMTGCAVGPERATVRADSWEEPGHIGENQKYEGFVEGPSVAFPAATGCDLLKFEPTLEVRPGTRLADEPVELGLKLNVPLVESPDTTATPQLRDSTVTLPEGMSVSPGAVDGIQACEAQGPHGINIEGPESEEVGVNGELQLAPGHCPNASTVGTAEAITPFLPVPVEGHVYLARPGCGGAGQSPCTEEDALDGNLYKLYLELGGTGELADTGVHFKVPGYVEANPATGQLTTRFLDTVQAPFSELKIKLYGGPRASLANPAVCGPAETTSDFTPWSAPGTTPEGALTAGTPDATPSSSFDVTGCADPVPFSPGFVAGTVSPQAGQYSGFTLNLSRNDREQYVKGMQVHTPPGLLAKLSSVPLCDQASANLGTCAASSKIGTTRVASGAGSHPFEIEGEVYLTGPYCGPPQTGVLLRVPGNAGCAPFGLSIVTHAVAGPFDLGLVVVRARIDIDREDSTARITLDESGPHAIPQILFGVPLRLKRVTANIDRPGFMFNPTNCRALRVSAAFSGAQDATASMSSPFAVAGCKSLAFKPKFTVFTNGRTSRTAGANLDAKVSYPAGSLGSEANIARVKVDLPKQLPSRLTTLQKACPVATFSSDPAGCPSASIVGMVRASTPLLPVGLAGPVYFVSHGGEAFPSLVVVLQGDDVRVDLTGTTFISKTGITSSTFKTVPDVPVNTFELFLPQGKYSALAANGNLCKEASKLIMPTEFVAQNGRVMHQRTKIAVANCRPGTAKTAPRVHAQSKSSRRRTGK